MNDRRKHPRLPVHARFEFNGQKYDVLDISPQGIFIRIRDDHEQAAVRQMLSGPFRFKLLDPATETSRELYGHVVRHVTASAGSGSGDIIGIGLVYDDGDQDYTVVDEKVLRSRDR